MSFVEEEEDVSERNYPKCREKQCANLELLAQFEHIIIVSGPISSGKTFCVKHVFELQPIAWINCESTLSLKDILSSIIEQLTGKQKVVSSWTKFARYFPKFPAQIIFDHFDELENPFDFFTHCEGFDRAKFIFIIHCCPTFICYEPLSYTNIMFDAYTQNEIFEILSQSIKKKNLLDIIKICWPITRDIREIMFVAYHVDGKINPEQILSLLSKEEVFPEIIDLPRATAGLLIGIYIGSHTTIVSDYLRFCTTQRKIRNPKLYEENEYIEIERGFALAKAIIDKHLGDFPVRFELTLGFNRLLELGLIEQQGNKVKCLANRKMVEALATSYKIDLTQYVLTN